MKPAIAISFVLSTVASRLEVGISCGFKERVIKDGQCVTTFCLLATTPMCAVGRFSASIVSRILGEALQHLKSMSFSLYVASSEHLKVLCASTATAFSLAASVRFEGKVSSHRL